MVRYPILDLTLHGKDVKKYVRDLEHALVQTLAAFELEAVTIEGLTGVWMPPTGPRGPRKIASIGVRVTRWVTTHGYALNVDLDPAPFTEWITACGLEDAEFTTMTRELGRPVTVAEAKPAAPPRSPTSSGWSWTPSRPSTVPDCGRSRCTTSSRCARAVGAVRGAALPRPYNTGMETSLPVAERPRRPEWMKVRAPTPDGRYFDVRKLSGTGRGW